MTLDKVHHAVLCRVMAQATETVGAKDFGWEEGEMTAILVLTVLR